MAWGIPTHFVELFTDHPGLKSSGKFSKKERTRERERERERVIKRRAFTISRDQQLGILKGLSSPSIKPNAYKFIINGKTVVALLLLPQS